MKGKSKGKQHEQHPWIRARTTPKVAQDPEEARFGRRLQQGDRYTIPETPGITWEVVTVGPYTARVVAHGGATRTKTVVSRTTGEVLAKFEEAVKVSGEGQVTRFVIGAVLVAREGA